MDRTAEITRTMVGLTRHFCQQGETTQCDETNKGKYVYSASKEDTESSVLGPDPEESLYFRNSFPQPSTQMVSDSSEQDAKHRDSHQGVENAEQHPSFGLGGDVSKT